MIKLIQEILNQKTTIAELDTDTLKALCNMECSMPDYLFDKIEWELNDRD